MGVRWRELALLLLLGLLWGMPFALTKISLADIPPFTLVACRVLLAAVALWLIVLARYGAALARRTFRRDIVLQGFLVCAAPYTLITLGQLSVPSALAAVLNSTVPLFVCLVGALYLGRGSELSTERLIGIVLGVCGVSLIVGVDAVAGFGDALAGQAAIIIASFSSAIAATYGRRFATMPPEAVAAGSLASAALILVPLSLLLESPISLSPSPQSLLALSANGLAATAGGFVIYFRLIQTLGSLGTASASYLKPAFGLLIGVALMGEAMSWHIILGLFAIFCGVGMTNGAVSPRFLPLRFQFARRD